MALITSMLVGQAVDVRVIPHIRPAELGVSVRPDGKAGFRVLKWRLSSLKTAFGRCSLCRLTAVLLPAHCPFTACPCDPAATCEPVYRLLNALSLPFCCLLTALSLPVRARPSGYLPSLATFWGPSVGGNSYLEESVLAPHDSASRVRRLSPCSAAAAVEPESPPCLAAAFEEQNAPFACRAAAFEQGTTVVVYKGTSLMAIVQWN